MLTTYYIDLVVGNVFGSKTEPSLPAVYYLGLSTTAPTANGTGVTEPAKSLGYSRVALDSLGAPNNGIVQNDAIITFPESTGSWGVVTHYVIYDAEDGGNLLLADKLNASKTVDADTIMTFKVGGIKLKVADLVS